MIVRSWAAVGLNEKVLRLAREGLGARARVVDLACGTGALSMELARSGFLVTAADIFPESFGFHGRLPFVEMDVEKAEDWGRLEGPFDAVFAVEVIEHLKNPAAFLGNCIGKLAPGGMLVLTTPNASHYVSRLMFLFQGFYKYHSPSLLASSTLTSEGRRLPPHVNGFTGWMIRSMMEEAGFRDISLMKSTNFLSGLLPIPLRPKNLFRWGCYYLLGALATPAMRSWKKDLVFSNNLIATGIK